MKSNHVVVVFFALVGAFLTSDFASAQSPSPASSSGKKPNIVVFMGDDVGWFNLSCKKVDAVVKAQAGQ